LWPAGKRTAFTNENKTAYKYIHAGRQIATSKKINCQNIKRRTVKKKQGMAIDKAQRTVTHFVNE
jgi:hypothetical protein